LRSDPVFDPVFQEGVEAVTGCIQQGLCWSESISGNDEKSVLTLSSTFTDP